MSYPDINDPYDVQAYNEYMGRVQHNSRPSAPKGAGPTRSSWQSAQLTPPQCETGRNRPEHEEGLVRNGLPEVVKRLVVVDEAGEQHQVYIGGDEEGTVPMLVPVGNNGEVVKSGDVWEGERPHEMSEAAREDVLEILRWIAWYGTVDALEPEESTWAAKRLGIEKEFMEMFWGE